MADSWRHGQGVFAFQNIREGEVIGIITGVVENDPDPNCEYTCWFEDGNGNWYTVNPHEPFRYLNHDADPNADWSSPVLIAIRNILVGEEITIHYGEEWETE